MLVLANGVWESRELWVSAGGSTLSHSRSPSPDGDPADTRLDNGYRFEMSSTRHIGHEIQYRYSRTHSTDDDGSILGYQGSGLMAIHQAGYNLLYYLTESTQESKLRAFVTGGFHVSDFPLPGLAAVQASSVKPGFNYGVGMKLRLSTIFSMRFDVRDYVTGKPNWNSLMFLQSGWLHQTGNVGLDRNFLLR
jgi:hypothetical protein